MAIKAAPQIIDANWRTPDSATQAAEGLSFTHNGQEFILKMVDGHLQPVPAGPEHPALDHRPYQHAQQALTHAFADESLIALQEQYRVRQEIDASYQDVPFGQPLGWLAKVVSDFAFREDRRKAQGQNRQALAHIRQSYVSQVTAYLTALQETQTAQLQFGGEHLAQEREAALEHQRFTARRVQEEHVIDFEDRRQERIAKSAHERQQSDTRTANAHQVRMTELGTQGQVDVLNASGLIELEKERLRLEIEGARIQHQDAETQRQEAREDELRREEHVHELIKRRQDLAKLIPHWQQQVEMLRATSPEEIAQAAARAYMAFSDAFLEWSAVSNPEELLRRAPQIEELAAAAVTKIMQGMSQSGPDQKAP